MKVEAILWMLVLVSIALAIVSRRYRIYGLLAVGFGILAVVVLIVITRRGDVPALPATAGDAPPPRNAARVDFEQFHLDKSDAEDPQAKNRIVLGELRFTQIRFDPGPESGTMVAVRARLFNDSDRFTLTDYAYHLAIEDCQPAACTAVYDQRGLAAVTIPPRQARDVTIPIHGGETHDTPPFKLLGLPKIDLLPTETRAYQPGAAP